MSQTASPPPFPTIFIYTEEQRGNQLVESSIIGSISDIAGMDKMIVVRDHHSRIDFIYRVDYVSSNLDAVAVSRYPETDFNGRTTVSLNGVNYRLGKPETALAQLRGKTEWIQDKGSVLSTLLVGAATKTPTLASRRIARERLTKIPRGVPVERLPLVPLATQAPAPEPGDG